MVSHDDVESESRISAHYQSYTTYVAATIHVRIAAQRGPACEAATLLGVCVQALEDNAATNPGVKKMRTTIQTLMQRLNVRAGPQAPDQVQDDFFGNGLDLEAIVRYVTA